MLTFSLMEISLFFEGGKRPEIDQMICTTDVYGDVKIEFILLRNEFGLVINVRNELFDLFLYTACTQEMPDFQIVIMTCVYADCSE